jgi:hypothetical protein
VVLYWYRQPEKPRPVQGDGDQAVTLTVAGFRGCPYARDASLNGWRCSSVAKHLVSLPAPSHMGVAPTTLVLAIFSASSSSRALRQIGHSQSSPPPSTISDGRGPAVPRLHFRTALASRSSFARRWQRSHRRRPAWISIPQSAHLFGAASGFGGTGGCVREDAGRDAASVPGKECRWRRDAAGVGESACHVLTAGLRALATSVMRRRLFDGVLASGEADADIEATGGHGGCFYRAAVYRGD